MNGTATSLSNSIADVLQDIGIPAHLSGYRYLADAIELVYTSDRRLPMTLSVYPQIAQQHGTTSINAERCMRHSIELAFTHGNVNVIYSIFKNSIDPMRGKATTGQFIYTVADTLKRKGYARTAPRR